MNKILLAAAVVAGFAAAPAMAADPNPPLRAVVLPPAPVGPAIMGYAGVGAAFGRLCDSGGSPCIDAWTAAAGGALNVPLSGSLNLEIEATAANFHLSGSGGPDDVDFAYGRGMLHGYMRNQAWAFGIYGGFENLTALGIWTIGAEAQAYLGNFTLYGQVATNSVNAGGDHSSFWSARGSAQLFLGQNVLIQGDIRYVSDFVGGGIGLGGAAVPATTFGGSIEGRMMGSPWSAFATVRHTTFDSSGGVDPVTAGLVGFRAHVGAMSLFQQYHQGASMNTVPFL